MISCDCAEGTDLDLSFPELEIFIGGKLKAKMILQGSTYMKYNGVNQCQSLIRGQAGVAGATYWLVGKPMFNAFEVFHDMEKRKLGFYSVPSSTSSVGKVEVETAGSFTLRSISCLLSLALAVSTII